MRTLSILLLSAVAAWGQVVVINTNPSGLQFHNQVNGNFSWLNLNKAATVHNHAMADVDGLVAALATLNNVQTFQPIIWDNAARAFRFLYTFSQTPSAGQAVLVDGDGKLNVPGGVKTGAATAFADLGTATFPTMVACADCTVGTTCSAGGTGAYAFATAAGGWVCPF